MRRAPAAFEGRLPDVAPAVLGGLGDKDAGAHAAMWDMLLSFVRAFPEAWSVIDARKAFLPRLLALLRCPLHLRCLCCCWANCSTRCSGISRVCLARDRKPTCKGMPGAAVLFPLGILRLRLRVCSVRNMPCGSIISSFEQACWPYGARPNA